MQLLKQIFSAMDHWAKSGLPSGDWYCAFTPRIPLEQVKVARRAFNTSFYCIVFSAVVGGLKTFAKSQGWNNEKLPLPDSLRTPIPVGKPNHPDNTLCNHWRPMLIDVPFGSRDTLSTITAVHSVLEKWKASTSSEFSGVVFRLLELFPVSFLVDYITRFHGLSLISSIASSSNDQLPPLFDKTVEDFFHFMPIFREHTAVLAWGCMSSNKHLRIGLTAEKSYFPKREHTQQIADFICKEFHNIYQLAQNRIDANANT